MTRSEVLELTNQLTERKAENVISLPLLYQHVLQELCGENRFWWRKKTFSFSTVAGTSKYDLSTQLSNAGITDVAVEEVTKVVLYTGSDTIELDPTFDDLSIVEYIVADATTGQPGVYTFDGTDYKTMRLVSTPDKVYTIYVSGWLMPNPASDTASDVVPLVPPWLHRGIVHGMEKYVWRAVYGAEDPKYLTAKDAYEKAMIQAQMRPRFTTNYTSQLISSEDSIQSTNGGSQF